MEATVYAEFTVDERDIVSVSDDILYV